MDPLIQKATELAKQGSTPYIPIPGRIAYVVSHGQSYASNGYAIRTQAIANALNDHGLETLCFVRQGRPWDLERTSATHPEMVIDGVRYIHTRWPNNKKPKTEAERLEIAADKLVELFRVYRPEKVLVASNYIVGIPAWIAAQRLNLPFYNEVRGFWELSMDAREPGYSSTPEFKTEAERDTFVAKQADKVFTLNEPMKDELAKRGVDQNCIELVPNGVSKLPNIKPANPELKTKLGVELGDKVVGYVGSFSAYEGLEVLLDCCAELVQNGEKIKLLLIGDSNVLTRHSSANKTQVEKPWLIQVGRVPHEEVADYYSLIDAVVIPRNNLPVCELVPPIKAAEALAHGKRLVVSNIAPLVEYAKKHDSVVTFETGKPRSLAQALRKALDMPAPQSANTLMQKHTEWMAKVLKGVIVSTPIGSSEFKLSNANQVDYSTARRCYDEEGDLTGALQVIESLKERGEIAGQSQTNLLVKLQGLMRLKGGAILPLRQPRPTLAAKHKHILYCLHQSVPHTTNGYATRSHGIAGGLQQTGARVRAVTRLGFPWDAGVTGIEGAPYETEVDSISYVAAEGPRLSNTPLDEYLSANAEHFAHEAEKFGAEVIIAASNHITALPALMAARRLGVPFVYEVRGLWEVTQASIQPRWAGSEHFRLMRKLERQVALEADLVITLTGEVAKELSGWGVPSDRVEVVPNAVDAERFQPMAPDVELINELNIKSDVPVIGYAGSAVAYEGLELLVEALAYLKKKGQDFYFLLVGDGKVINTVKSRAKELDIEEECRFTGRVPFEQVPRYLSCMNIMPIPRLSSSVTEMVSALKPLEAMAMGKAVVLSDVSPHLIMAGPSGERALLFKKDSAESLSEAIQRLIDSPEERQRIGQAARVWIEKERTWSRVASRYSEAVERLLLEIPKATQSSGERKFAKGRQDSNLIALSILDEISEECWKYEFKQYLVSRTKYKEQIEESKADFCFVESCWKGNRGDWQYAFTSPGLKHKNSEALLDLLPKVREKMPVLFWNKEDPMHFEKFLPIAKYANVIFTTDSNKISDYKRDVPGADVYAVPFAAQQKICNPSGRFLSEPETVCFAGSYYSVGHDERKRQMHALLPSIIEFNGAIYDRFSKLGNERYKFPEEFQPYIRDAVPFDEVVRLYKQFKVFLNVNTIIDSPTMMSRRVYELLACGTPVVSTPSRAIEEQFSGIVHVANNAYEANKIIEKLLTDSHYWDKTSHVGYREVMKNHTYAHRYQEIKKSLGYGEELKDPCVSIVTCTRRPHMIDRIVENVGRQNHESLELILWLQDFSKGDVEKLRSSLASNAKNLKSVKVVEDNSDQTLGQRFNSAARLASGEYIAKMDDDDFYFENYLSDMLIPFSFGDYAMVGKREVFMYLSASKKLIRRFPGQRHMKFNFVAGPTFVIKKSVFDEIGFESRNTGEDSSFLKNLVEKGYSVYASDPFNFIQFRSSQGEHTWGKGDEYFLSNPQVTIESDGFDTSILEF